MTTKYPFQQEAEATIIKCYRVEYRQLIAILIGSFGPHNMELAEDIIQETFIEAIDNWRKKGVPENVSGWLFKVAKNKTLNVLNREKYYRQYEAFKKNFDRDDVDEPPILNQTLIQDEQLKMMFVCCHKALSSQAQMALILKTLCGFSIDEIATAFLSKKETITKRLTRARGLIREANLSLELPDVVDLKKDLDTVLKTIYLLYNEGYNASKGKLLIKKELCLEAIHLVNILATSSLGNKPNTHALLSLMYFNYSRFDARQDNDGKIILLEDQDRSKWDNEAIALGYYHLSKIVQQDEISTYHLQASIAACHAGASRFEETDWTKILSLYELLYQFDPSPIVFLNKAVATSHVHGPEKALVLLENKTITSTLDFYFLFHVTKADLNAKLNRYDTAIKLLNKAKSLTKIAAEKNIIDKRLKLFETMLK